AAEQALTERDRALDERGDELRRLQAELGATKQDLSASQDAQEALARASDDRLAAMRESLGQELSTAMAAREAAEQALAERDRALDQRVDELWRMQAELAAMRQDVARAEDVEHEHDSPPAMVAASEVEPQRLDEIEAELAPRQQADASAAPSTDIDWVLDDRVIGRLLDFRARERATGKRRKIFWGVAAGLAMLVAGAAAAAGKLWLTQDQRAESSEAAEDDALIREAFVKPGLR
ncbi:MAG TPA: hypothetical protein VF306_04710, partial [Pirellulales bacterium]